MPSFKLTVPSSLDEALSLLNPDDDVLLWGGGVASTILMKQKLLAPSVVIGLERVQELYGITQEEDGSLRLGAMVRLRDMELSPLLAGLLPSLSETAKVIANVRVRNAATLGGHLIHADPAQDLPPMLLALDAAVKLQSKTGQRIVALNEFFCRYDGNGHSSRRNSGRGRDSGQGIGPGFPLCKVSAPQPGRLLYGRGRSEHRL